MKVWILNHYAGEYFRDKAWRHYWIAKYLKRMGHEPVVFCSNAVHGSDGELYYDTDEPWHVHMAEEIGVPFVFVKSRPYAGEREIPDPEHGGFLPKYREICRRCGQAVRQT